jgi:hypothetical protein
MGCSLSEVTVVTQDVIFNGPSGNITQPTNKWQFGIRTPLAGNIAEIMIGERLCMAMGCYAGWVIGNSHSTTNLILSQANEVAIAMVGSSSPPGAGTGVSDPHGAAWQYIQTSHCPYHIAGWDPVNGVGSLGSGHVFPVECALWDFEDADSTLPAWQTTNTHLLDANNQIQGSINYLRVLANTGQVHGLIVSGAQNVAMKDVTLPPQNTVPTNVQTFVANGTWVKPPGVKTVRVQILAGGGGGASGAVKMSGVASPGGNGGGGAGYTDIQFPASELTASVAVTAPNACGLGGAAVTSSDTAGNSGKNGPPASFGSYAQSLGGLGGSATPGSVGAQGLGNTQSGGSGAQAVSTGGPALNAVPIGMTAGGGAGGGITTAGSISAGSSGAAGSSGLNGGGSGTSGAAGGNGASTSDANLPLGGGGGGGGASGVTSGKSGGNGGTYGGGGGGGGGANNGGASGAGGTGGPGIVIVTSW